MLFCDIGASIRASFDTFMYGVCTWIYELIINLYNLFDLLCHGRLLDNEFMQQISFRVGLILGLLMFFRVAFSFIQYLINPDIINDKEKGAFNLVKKVLIVIVLLGSYSYIFDFAFKIQNLLLGYNEGNVNVISRLLLPEVVESDNFGAVLSSDLLFTFYNMNDSLIPEEYRELDEYETCALYRSALKRDIIQFQEFYLGYHCLDDDYMIEVKSETANSDVNVRVINFNSFLAPTVGLFVCWVLLMYCLSVGVRIIQFAFLEIIAPVAIISNLAPGKSETFSKWLKMCMTTYFDIFIRVAIIDFVVLIIANVINGFNSNQGVFWESLLAAGNSEVLASSKSFVKVIIVLALLMFAKKAPELIKELLPKSWAASGDFGFSLKKRVDNMVGGKQLQQLPSRAIGFGVGGLIGGVMSAASRFNTKMRAGKGLGSALGAGLMGFGVGTFRGGFGSAKKGNIVKNVGASVKNVRSADNKYNDLILSGGTPLGAAKSWLVDNFNDTKAQRSNRMIKDMEAMSKFKSSLNKTAEEISFVSSLKTSWENMQQFNGETLEDFTDRKNKAQQHYKAVRKLAQEAALTGVHTQILREYKWTDHTGAQHIETLTTPVSYDFSADVDDKAYLASMVSIKEQANDYSIAHNVQYYDNNSGTYKTIGNINTRSDISELSSRFENTKAELQKQGLVAAEAEDRYAGVDSNKQKK